MVFFYQSYHIFEENAENLKNGPIFGGFCGSFNTHLSAKKIYSLNWYWPYLTFQIPPLIILAFLHFSLHPITSREVVGEVEMGVNNVSGMVGSNLSLTENLLNG